MKIRNIFDKYSGVLGIVFITIGGLSDRILYHQVYLHSLGKTFDWLGSFDDVFAYYKHPYSWFPLMFIGIGLLLAYLPTQGK